MEGMVEREKEIKNLKKRKRDGESKRQGDRKVILGMNLTF